MTKKQTQELARLFREMAALLDPQKEQPAPPPAEDTSPDTIVTVDELRKHIAAALDTGATKKAINAVLLPFGKRLAEIDLEAHGAEIVTKLGAL